MKIRTHLDQEVDSLFARCPELCGFSVRAENDELFVSDVGISPRLFHPEPDAKGGIGYSSWPQLLPLPQRAVPPLLRFP